MLNNIFEIEKLYENKMVETVLNNNNYAPVWGNLIPVIDGNLRARYGVRGLLEYYSRTDDDSVKADFETILYVYLKSREKEYNVLYDLIDLEYNPIENYSMTEHEKGANTSDNMYGGYEEKNEMQFGQRATGTVKTYGKSTATETADIGAIKTNETDEGKKAPFDSESYENVDKNTISNMTEERTDVITSVDEEHHDKDDFTEDAHTDNSKKTMSERGDTLHTDHERTLSRSGNVGVTTSQQMIESSMILAPKYNLVDKISRDIANLISKGVYFAL